MKTLIETDRLILRAITVEDKDNLFQLHSDPDVQKYTGEPLVESIEEIESAIQMRIKDYQKYGFGRLALIQKNTGNFIGWAGLAYLPEFDKVDLGYRLKKKYWGMGFSTEASMSLIEYGFNSLKLDLIIAIALPENKASIRVMEKVGMMFDKQAPYDEDITNAIWYKLERKDYNKRNFHKKENPQYDK